MQWFPLDLCCSSLTFVVWLLAGSGRVTFNNQRSYLKAVTAAFVEIKTTKFTKKVSGAGGAAQGGVCMMGGTAGSTSVLEPAPYSCSSSGKWDCCSASPRGAAGGGFEVAGKGAAPCPLPGSPAGSDRPIPGGLHVPSVQCPAWPILL